MQFLRMDLEMSRSIKSLKWTRVADSVTPRFAFPFDIRLPRELRLPFRFQLAISPGVAAMIVLLSAFYFFLSINHA